MLDVLHYFFEEDYRYSSSDNSSQQSYRDFDSEISGEPDEPAEVIQPFNPRERKATKAFIEATPIVGDEIKPFGSILDSPIG